MFVLLPTRSTRGSSERETSSSSPAPHKITAELLLRHSCSIPKYVLRSDSVDHGYLLLETLQSCEFVRVYNALMTSCDTCLPLPSIANGRTVMYLLATVRILWISCRVTAGHGSDQTLTISEKRGQHHSHVARPNPMAVLILPSTCCSYINKTDQNISCTPTTHCRRPAAII